MGIWIRVRVGQHSIVSAQSYVHALVYTRQWYDKLIYTFWGHTVTKWAMYVYKQYKQYNKHVGLAGCMAQTW